LFCASKFRVSHIDNHHSMKRTWGLCSTLA
jgi:hypothetical protein